MTRRRGQAEVAARFLRQCFPCTELLLGENASHAIEKFCDSLAERCVEQAEPGVWTTFLCSGIARDFDLPPFTEDVAMHEGTIASLAASDDARRDAELFAKRNANISKMAEEKRWLRVPFVGKHVYINHYAYNAPAIVKAIENCDRIGLVAQPSPCTVLLVRSHDQMLPRAILINDSVEALLAACDGIADCATVVRRVIADGNAYIERDACFALEVLQEKNVVTYRQSSASG